ncbi:NADH-ubiquinone oxidoreductase Complex1 subunit [Pyrrhoderma noxium]|uniref:NADH-ubiquinone oxidoreductase Complex1 subunit n=1 Tax=Pyrrhoderma noxium TaxID=2282107 RepID=A0A286U857_9AGAM|nr:NADH-ubiquinone oxidoreductase Complex1 subunit [Pyrrhoderma noxium]
MTTIPSRLSQISRVSGSPSVARQRVLQLYRNWYRSAPEIVAAFGLNVHPNAIRRAVREEIERNRYVSDPKVIDVLLLKGQQSYQEVMNSWAQEPHILGLLLAPKGRPQRTFMQKFLEGRDEDQVLPAATGVAVKDTAF